MKRLFGLILSFSLFPQVIIGGCVNEIEAPHRIAVPIRYRSQNYEAAIGFDDPHGFLAELSYDIALHHSMVQGGLLQLHHLLEEKHLTARVVITGFHTEYPKPIPRMYAEGGEVDILFIFNPPPAGSEDPAVPEDLNFALLGHVKYLIQHQLLDSLRPQVLAQLINKGYLAEARKVWGFWDWSDDELLDAFIELYSLMRVWDAKQMLYEKEDLREEYRWRWPEMDRILKLPKREQRGAMLEAFMEFYRSRFKGRQGVHVALAPILWNVLLDGVDLGAGTSFVKPQSRTN